VATKSLIPSFKDLVVWQKAMDLAVRLYPITQKYPPDERFDLIAETRKTARSVTYNIAEGKRRFSSKEFRQFISIAQGSLGELQTQVLIAGRLKYLEPSEVEGLERDIEEIGRMLRGLEKALA